MISGRWLAVLVALFACAACGSPAHAHYHFMQIEQVIGGVNGDVSAQAIQLRMRTVGQDLTNHAQIYVRDAAGENPILILDLTTDVANGATGDRVLITSPAFQSYVSPAQTPDFTMANLIPASYLAAGSLTWEEDDTGVVQWRLSWGGAGYTGPGTLEVTNDADGDANPAFTGGLPNASFQALKFNGATTAPSTTSAADYSVTAGASVWTNNARVSETAVGGPASVDGSEEIGAIELGAPSPNPGPGAFSFSVAMPRAAHVRVAVYQASGQRVRTLIDRELAAGRRNFSWDGRNERGERVASGAYYMRLESGDVRRSRKLMVIR